MRKENVVSNGTAHMCRSWASEQDDVFVAFAAQLNCWEQCNVFVNQTLGLRFLHKSSKVIHWVFNSLLFNPVVSWFPFNSLLLILIFFCYLILNLCLLLHEPSLLFGHLLFSFLFFFFFVQRNFHHLITLPFISSFLTILWVFIF